MAARTSKHPLESTVACKGVSGVMSMACISSRLMRMAWLLPQAEIVNTAVFIFKSISAGYPNRNRLFGQRLERELDALTHADIGRQGFEGERGVAVAVA